MLAKVKLCLATVMMLALLVDKSSCAASYTISVTWIYRGNALVNNTVLTFNKDDTLNLACAASASAQKAIFFTLTKGTAPPTNVNMTAISSYAYKMTYTNPQTLIYDDFYGTYDGYENIIVLTKNSMGLSYTYDFKLYINVPLLRPADGGKYFCTAATTLFSLNGPTFIDTFTSSGALNIQVNVKPGQARSSRADARNLLTYSAVLLSASKLLL